MFHNNERWVKQDGNSDSEVTMESNDGAEACELVGLFMLDKFSKRLAKTVLVYIKKYLKITMAIKMIKNSII